MSLRRASAVLLLSFVLLSAAAFAGDPAPAKDGKRKAPPVARWRVSEIAVSPDGNRVAAVVSHGLATKVRLREVGAATELEIDTEYRLRCDAAFVDAGRSLLLSGFTARRLDTRTPTVECRTLCLRTSDAVDLWRPAADADGPADAVRALRDSTVSFVAPDGESLVTLADERRTLEFRHPVTAELRRAVKLAEPVTSVLSIDTGGDWFVQLHDDTLARVGGADGKIVWRTAPPKQGDDTTRLPGEAEPPAAGLFVGGALVTSDRKTAVADLRQDSVKADGWRQRIVVACDWDTGKEAWRERPQDRLADEVFIVPSRDLVGIVHGRDAVLRRGGTGEVAGTVTLDAEPTCVAFGHASDVGWAGGWNGEIVPVDVSGIPTN